MVDGRTTFAEIIAYAPFDQTESTQFLAMLVHNKLLAC